MGERAAKLASSLGERRAVGSLCRHERDHARLGLGERARLVRAHHIHRRERLDRVQLLREHAAPRDLVRGHGGGEVDQQDQPLRHEADDTRGYRLDPCFVGVNAGDDRDRQRDRERYRSGDDPQQQPVVRALQRRARVAEAARRRGQLRGTAVVADCGRLEQRTAFDDERTGPHRLPAIAHHRFGLAGEVSLIERQPIGLDQRPVRHDLVARRQPHEVVGDHLLDGHATIHPVAHHQCVGRHQRREPVELALGADLLEGPDRDVRHQDPEEQRIPPRRERDRENPEHEQDRVGDGQRVRTDDARVRTARPLRCLPPARGQTPAGLDAGQPPRRRPRASGVSIHAHGQPILSSPRCACSPRPRPPRPGHARLARSVATTDAPRPAWRHAGTDGYCDDGIIRGVGP